MVIEKFLSYLFKLLNDQSVRKRHFDMNKMSKKGVSPVVATVLLLVLTIVIAGVVFSVVIPFVNDKLGKSKDCLDVLDGVEFPESKFNCYDTGNTGFSVKLKQEKISGFRVALIGSDGSSDVFNIENGDTGVSGLRMVGPTPNDIIKFPSVGEQRSYVAIGKVYEKAEISPITNSSEVCAVADVIEFEPCARGVAL